MVLVTADHWSARVNTPNLAREAPPSVTRLPFIALAVIPLGLIAVVIGLFISTTSAVHGNPLAAFPVDPGSYRQGLTFTSVNGGNEVIEGYYDNHPMVAVEAYYAQALAHGGWTLEARSSQGNQWTFRRVQYPNEKGTIILTPLQPGVIVRITYVY
jgi:hypothetical protein